MSSADARQINVDLPQRDRVDSEFTEQPLGGEDKPFVGIRTDGGFSGRLNHD
jgi:hypothetical protein